MAGALAIVQDYAIIQAYAGSLLALGWAVVIALHVVALVRIVRRRKIVARPDRIPVLRWRNVTAVRVEPVVPLHDASQIGRLFAVLERAGQSAERAIDAHAMAAKHLDSAEYQLLRLFDEFPMLMSASGRTARAPAVQRIEPLPLPRALAA